jgi:Flp pilus assembly protein TadB
MAQTKKKRRRKHRGNAAGTVEVRGRAAHKRTDAERKASGKEMSSADRRRERMLRAPTWKSAATRAAMAAAVFGLLLAFLIKTPIAQAISLTVFVFLFYVPLGYYTDLMLYRRRTRVEAKAKT